MENINKLETVLSKTTRNHQFGAKRTYENNKVKVTEAVTYLKSNKAVGFNRTSTEVKERDNFGVQKYLHDNIAVMRCATKVGKQKNG